MLISKVILAIATIGGTSAQLMNSNILQILNTTQLSPATKFVNLLQSSNEYRPILELLASPGNHTIFVPSDKVWDELQQQQQQQQGSGQQPSGSASGGGLEPSDTTASGIPMPSDQTQQPEQGQGQGGQQPQQPDQQGQGGQQPQQQGGGQPGQASGLFDTSGAWIPLPR